LGDSWSALLEGWGGERKRGLLDERDPCGDTNVRYSMSICSDSRRVLGRLAEYEIGLPLLDRLLEGGQHRVDVQRCEDHPDHDEVALSRRKRGHPAPEWAEDLVRRSRAGPELVALRLQRRRADNERLVAGSRARIDVGNERSEVPGALRRCEEDTHGVRL
jgi:hypothetical protein